MGEGVRHAVSISLGSARRDKEVTIELMGHRVNMRRIGTNGDEGRARALFEQLDGKVDALGIGGIDLWLGDGERPAPLRSAQRLVRGVKQTPVTDGRGLKLTLERRVVPALVHALGSSMHRGRVLLVSALDRPGMAQSFFEHGYQVLCGDLGFGLGLPIPIRRQQTLRLCARLALPVVGRLPIKLLYPTGADQDEVHPRFGSWYRWATVIAGDCHYIKRHMPRDLAGKVIVTNTTTRADLERFAERGVRSVLTTTPTIEGRTFGTNMIEAALIAVAAGGQGRLLSPNELSEMVDRLGMRCVLHRLEVSDVGGAPRVEAEPARQP